MTAPAQNQERGANLRGTGAAKEAKHTPLGGELSAAGVGQFVVARSPIVLG